MPPWQEDTLGYFKTGDVDGRGHQKYCGYDTERQTYYLKTHRGNRGKRQNSESSQAELAELQRQLEEERQKHSEQLERERSEAEKKELDLQNRRQ